MLGLTLLASLPGGCSAGRENADSRPVAKPRVLVVAPVVNLSPSDAFDPLRITDLVASELQSFSGVSVIPVNLTLAALARRGQSIVQTPQEALELAREFGADATLVTAITEYDPYDPPSVGLVMQLYEHPWRAAPPPTFDPVSASRQAAAVTPPQARDATEPGPAWQVQRVFHAAEEEVLEDVRAYAERRAGDVSPYAWRKYTKVQELYVRYCCWATIRTMMALENGEFPQTVGPDEASP